MEFYDDVLRQLIVAMGAALFLGNLVALVRRRADARRAAVGGPAEARRRDKDGEELPQAPMPQAPLARTLLYMLLGLVVMVWGIASLAAG